MVSKGFPNVTTSGRQYNIGEKPSVIVHLTLTDPLRIQPWSQYTYRRNQTTYKQKITETPSEKKKQGRKQTKGNGQESSQQRTSSPGTDAKEKKKTGSKKHKIICIYNFGCLNHGDSATGRNIPLLYAQSVYAICMPMCLFFYGWSVFL